MREKERAKDEFPGEAPASTILTDKRKREVAMRIREARLMARQTQEQAAVIVGCSLPRYNRVERAESDLSILEAELLAKAFGVPVTYFLRQLAEYA